MVTTIRIEEVRPIDEAPEYAGYNLYSNEGHLLYSCSMFDIIELRKLLDYLGVSLYET